MPRNNEIQFRRGTGTEWQSIDPILSSGEPAFNVSDYTLKIGDGSKHWSELPTFASSGDIYLESVSFNNITRNLTFSWNHSLPSVSVTIPGGSGASSGSANYQNVSSNINVTYDDYIIFVDTSASAVDLHLPLASGYGGKQFIVKQKQGSNPINIIPSGSETIDEHGSYQIFYQKNSIGVVSDNSNWYII